MIMFESSKELTISSEIHDDPIQMIYQFFVHPNAARHAEIQYVLKKNCENPEVKQIVLLNERLYTAKELGIESPKIIQIIIGKRLTFQAVFKHIEESKYQGYNVIVNADIFINEQIQLVRRSNLHNTKSMLALLRYDYNPHTNKSVLFGPRPDSQDTWIIHSNQLFSSKYFRLFNFEFGKPGCDNKIIYLMYLLGYSVYNVPNQVKTYHVHNTNIRNYSKKDLIQSPYIYFYPFGYSEFPNNNYQNIYKNFSINKKYCLYSSENSRLYDYIQQQFSLNKPFILPRIAGIENNFAIIGHYLKQNGTLPKNQMDYIGKMSKVMKNNAGILISNNESLVKYSDMYLEAFQNCDIFADWEPWGNVYQPSQEEVRRMCQKQSIWAFTFDIFHFVFYTPWTFALQNKRILLISPFEESLAKQIPIRENIYGKDLFPGCTFELLKPPQTQGLENSRDFSIELHDFFTQLDQKHELYDIALVSAGGYGNLICNYIYSSGKSAIYVGGVLQMYFGIYGERWLRERKDVMNLFLNSNWIRPNANERPNNYKQVEKSCYW